LKSDSSVASPSREGPVLELDGISVEPGNDPFSLQIYPGELVLFECAENFPIPDLWDVFVGLDQPALGKVSFGGKAWEDMPEEEKEANRLSVGCVFSAGDKYESQWLDNLDIDENVVLAQSMNPACPSAEWEGRLAELLRHFEMEELSGKRPNQVSPAESMRAQWIRAFLPKPLRLLILERPDYGLPVGLDMKLVDRMMAARESGTAVLWIDLRRSDAERSALGPTKHFTHLPSGLV